MRQMRYMLRMLVVAGMLFAVHTGMLSPAETGESSFTIVPLGDHALPYISLVDLAERYNLELRYDPVLQKLTAHRGSRSIAVSDQSATATYNGTPVNLQHPAQLIQGALFVPAQTFLPLFSSLVPGEISWDDRRGRVDTSQVTHSITSLDFEHREGGLLVRIGLAEPLIVRDTLTDNRMLELTFPGGTYDEQELFGNLPAEISPMIHEISHRQETGTAVLSFLVSDEMGTYSTRSTSNPPELQLSLRYHRDDADGTIADNVLFPDDPKPFVNDELIFIDTVIIDPGHGGKDPGAIGPAGTYEKNIVLAIALELQKIIKDRKEIRAVLTRERDVYPTLQERAKIASINNGKLYISIHANGLENPRVDGMEAYFLSEAKTDDAKRVAERENAVLRFEDNPGFYTGNLDLVSRIQFDMLSNVYIDESRYLCQLLLEKGVQATKQRSRGVKQAGLYVLMGTQALMPSVLFEIGYITNPEEEKMLNRVSYQKRVAQAIYDAIIDFKRRAERDVAIREP